ncbi:MAG: DUF2189 domain-containing protein [Rhodobacteraceae bacterium]|nr:DUF2189 domain-containing protein [Paracoccaceae bacterium]
MSQNEPSPTPEIQIISVNDLFDALKKGWGDYKKAPLMGLFFSAAYVAGGIVLYLVLAASGKIWWIMPISVGFPLIAPFAAVGLFEISRQLEANEPLKWGHVLGVVFAERQRQIPWVGAIIVIWFLFYMLIAHMIFALMLGIRVMTHIGTSLDVFLTPAGLLFINIELLVGAVFALLLFAITFVSLPLLLHKEIDFITAIILSIQSVKKNFAVLIVWFIIIGPMMLLSLVPMFLGLLITLPVLGHATWHLYRKLLLHPA